MGEPHFHQGARVVLNKLSKHQNYSRENLTFEEDFHDGMKGNGGEYQGFLMRHDDDFNDSSPTTNQNSSQSKHKLSRPLLEK